MASVAVFEQFVIDRNSSQLFVGIHLRHQFSKALVELRRTATGIGKQDAAVFEIRFEAISFCLIERELEATVHIGNRVVVEIHIAGIERARLRPGGQAGCVVHREEHVPQRVRSCVPAAGVFQLNDLQQAPFDAVLLTGQRGGKNKGTGNQL